MQLFSASESILKLMVKNNMKLNDVNFVPLVIEADEMSSKGEQKSYIVQHLADKYDVSDRTVYSIIDRLHSEISL